VTVVEIISTTRVCFAGLGASGHELGLGMFDPFDWNHKTQTKLLDIT